MKIMEYIFGKRPSLSSPIEPYFIFLDDQLTLPKEKVSELLNLAESIKSLVHEVVPQVVDVLPFGSLTRDTCLPPLDGRRIDLDILIIMEGSAITSGKMMGEFDNYSAKQKRFLQLCEEGGNFQLSNAVDAFCMVMNDASPFNFVSDAPAAVFSLGQGQIEVTFAANVGQHSDRFTMSFRKLEIQGRYPKLEAKYNRSPGISSGESGAPEEKVYVTRAVPFQHNEIQKWADESYKIQCSTTFRLIKYLARKNSLPIPTWYLEVDFYDALSKSENIPEGATVHSLALSFFTDARWHNHDLYMKFSEFKEMRRKIDDFRAALNGRSSKAVVDKLLKLAPPPSGQTEEVSAGLIEWLGKN